MRLKKHLEKLDNNIQSNQKGDRISDLTLSNVIIH